MLQSPSELPLSWPAPPAAVDDALDIVMAGERVALLADRAVHWPRERTLFVADVHLGKAAAFRAGGVPLPRGATAADLARLTRLVATTGATRVVILGDFFHARAGRVAALDDTFMTWRRAHATLAMTLVRGNHDARAGDPPLHWDVACVADPHALPPFIGCHQPVAPRTGYALCGHIHPGVFLSGPAGESARLPCFVIGRRRAILPAYGRFTGLARADVLEGDRFVAIAGRRLFPLPGPA